MADDYLAEPSMRRPALGGDINSKGPQTWEPHSEPIFLFAWRRMRRMVPDEELYIS